MTSQQKQKVLYIYICTYIHVCIYGSFSFVGLTTHKTECALLACRTWVHSGSWVCIDDSYQTARPLSLRPSLAGMYTHTDTHTHVCCVLQQTRLLFHTAKISAVSHSRYVCCVTQQTCLPCHTADMSASVVPHSRHVCCVTQIYAYMRNVLGL